MIVWLIVLPVVAVVLAVGRGLLRRSGHTALRWVLATNSLLFMGAVALLSVALDHRPAQAAAPA
ncbi:ATP synthase subunit C, partial [Streptomyces antimycoticus]